MKIKPIAVIYSFIIGSSMIGMWTMFLITDSIPELDTEPLRIGMHMFAELATGVTLLIGAIGIQTKKTWGYSMYLISLGMLLYTLIASPGYYADKGDILFVGMFLILLIITIIVAVMAFVKKEDFKPN